MNCTTAQAAGLAGIKPASFRREMSRERGRGRDYRRPGPDKRTPLWDEAELRQWLAARPGPGNWR